MRFFIDFEATQFSERIINIGCIAENGNTFSTLVKPTRKKDKLTKFITDLTGITSEMLATAPSADEAFNSFFDFVIENAPNEINEYFCYGDSDAQFIERTLHDMVNTRAIAFATMLRYSLIDYSGEVKNYFQMSNNVALKKVYSLILQDEVEQHHNALEDAQMLFTVVTSLKNKCHPEDSKKIAAMPKVVKEIEPPNNRLKSAPAQFVNWPGDKWAADTGANETNWAVCCYINNKPMKYFNSIETAILWVMKYASKGMSPKNLNHYKIIRNRIEASNKIGNGPYGFTWKIREGAMTV